MFKYFLYVVGLFLLSTTFVVAQKTMEMSLEECIKYGLENNKGIKIAGDNVNRHD